VGRDAEFQRIRDAMASEPGIVLVGGPGVGKTRLGYEVITGADRQRYVSRWAAAVAATAKTPLGAFASLLPADLPTNPVAMLRGAADALLGHSGTRRLVLGVDDAHLLDELSAILVHHLARTRRAFVLVSLRSRHAAPDPIRALWKDGLASRVEIAALSPAGTADVLAAALGGEVDSGTTQRLCRVAQGDLLLLCELVRAGRDSGALTEVAGVWRWIGRLVITPRLVELVSDRIGRLERPEQDILEIVAYGEPIGADVLTSLADPGLVEALEARGLLWAQQDGRRIDVRLAHPLYGQVLRRTCPPTRAAALRRALADAVEATGARREDDWLRIVTWRLDSATPLRPEVLIAAAGRALAVLDLPLAQRLARTAFETGGDPAAAGAVLCRALLLSERSAEAEDVLAQLAGIPMSANQRGEYALGRAYNLFWGLHRVDDAYAWLRTTRDGPIDSVWRDELDLLDCVFQVMQAKVGQALGGLASLQNRPGLSRRVAAQIPVAQGIALVHLGRLGQAGAVLDSAVELVFRQTADIPWVTEIHRLYRCQVALFAGRLDEADELAAAFYAHAAQARWDFPVRLSCCVQAQAARLRGRVRTATRWAREGLRLFGPQRSALFHQVVLGELAHAEALAGRGPAALAALAQADGRPAPAEALLQPWIELARPWVAVATGDLVRAVELAGAAARYARTQDAAGFEAVALHDLVRLGTVSAAVDRLCQLSEIVDSDLVHAFAAHAVAVADGDPVGMEAAGTTFARLGADLLAAEAYGQAAQGHGAAVSSRRLRAQAALLLDGCEGAQTPLTAGITAPQLTTRERDIARLAAAGLSNREIADRMVISSRTVGNHLHHVYAKLGINGRWALAGLLPPLEPVTRVALPGLDGHP
jgi:DNA-binding CsgD family transcriptional regulator